MGLWSLDLLYTTLDKNSSIALTLHKAKSLKKYRRKMFIVILITIIQEHSVAFLWMQVAVGLRDHTTESVQLKQNLGVVSTVGID